MSGLSNDLGDLYGGEGYPSDEAASAPWEPEGPAPIAPINAAAEAWHHTEAWDDNEAWHHTEAWDDNDTWDPTAQPADNWDQAGWTDEAGLGVAASAALADSWQDASGVAAWDEHEGTDLVNWDAAPAAPTWTGDGHDTGYHDTGYHDTGYQDTGYQDTGHQVADYHDTDYQDTGHQVADYHDTGYHDTDYQDTGHQVADYHDTGYQDTDYPDTDGQFSGVDDDERVWDPTQAWEGVNSALSGSSSSQGPVFHSTWVRNDDDILPSRKKGFLRR